MHKSAFEFFFLNILLHICDALDNKIDCNYYYSIVLDATKIDKQFFIESEALLEVVMTNYI